MARPSGTRRSRTAAARKVCGGSTIATRSGARANRRLTAARGGGGGFVSQTKSPRGRGHARGLGALAEAGRHPAGRRERTHRGRTASMVNAGAVGQVARAWMTCDRVVSWARGGMVAGRVRRDDRVQREGRDAGFRSATSWANGTTKARSWGARPAFEQTHPGVTSAVQQITWSARATRSFLTALRRRRQPDGMQ